MTDSCQRAHRSRLATPTALLLGAVLVSAGSATAATVITGAQIKDGTVTSADVANDSITGTDLRSYTVGPTDLSPASVGSGAVKDGTLGAVDLQPGVANKLTAVLSRQGQSADLLNVSGWQWTLPVEKLFTFKVTKQQRFTVQGIVGYQVGAAVSVDVAVCRSVNGSEPTFMGPTYGTVTVEQDGRFNAPVQADTTASGVTLRVGPCLRAGGAADWITDVSSMSVIMSTD